MYCIKHDVFWCLEDSIYCPVCLIEYSENMEAHLKTFIANKAHKIKPVEEGDVDGEDQGG